MTRSTPEPEAAGPLEVEVTAPLLLAFAGAWWPLGGPAARVVVTAPADGPGGRVDPRSVVAAGDLGLRLLVEAPAAGDPGVAEDEGPLALEAAALRRAGLATPLLLRTGGAWPPMPGAEAARRVAADVALAAWADAARAPGAGGPDGGPAAGEGARAPERVAAASARPVEAATGAPLPLDAAALAELDASAVVFLDRPGLVLTPPGDEASAHAAHAWRALATGAAGREALRGAGLASPRAWRDEAVAGALVAAGLLARLPLGEGAWLGLTEAGRAPALRATLAEHGLDPLPCRFAGASALACRVRAATGDPRAGGAP